MNSIPKYAGFWKRFIAYIIDKIIIGIAQGILLFPLYMIIGLFSFLEGSSREYEIFSKTSNFVNNENEMIAASIVVLIAIVVGFISIGIEWLYYALMESSRRQATLGKIALNIKVVDQEGNRISFGRATGRYFGKILSGLIFMIGYIMAAFTAHKQALHDILANCYVVNDSHYQQNETKVETGTPPPPL